MSYSNKQLRILAQQNPKELIRIIISPNGDAKTLAVGAEVLGEEVTNESLVVPTLRQLLKHPHALVREGALNGVAAFFSDKPASRDILELLRFIAKSDPLTTNKETAIDIISSFEKK
jgi:hypothetical protein